MTEFGETLRKAREAKGLTIMQVSDLTRMLPQQIEDLEKENFSRIAAPIYGRGFVKLYCGAVGIDPKPLVDEFMDIFTGNKQPSIKLKHSVRNAEPTVRPAPQVEPEPEVTMPTVVPHDDGIVRAAAVEDTPATPPPPPPQEEVTMPPPPPPPQPEEVTMPPAPAAQDEVTLPSQPQDDLFYSNAGNGLPPIVERRQPPREESAADAMLRAVEAQPPSGSEPFRLEQEVVRQRPRQRPQIDDDFGGGIASRYAAPPPVSLDRKYSDFYVPPVVWRVMALVAGAAIIILLMYALGKKLWRAATVAPVDEPAIEQVATTPENAEKPNETSVSPHSAPAGERKERTPVKLPPLYFE